MPQTAGHHGTAETDSRSEAQVEASHLIWRPASLPPWKPSPYPSTTSERLSSVHVLGIHQTAEHHWAVETEHTRYPEMEASHLTRERSGAQQVQPQGRLSPQPSTTSERLRAAHAQGASWALDMLYSAACALWELVTLNWC